MIKFMKSWCEGIIVAIVISIIIEILIPEGNNKKYVKVVSGIFIIFVVLNPILSKLNKNFEIEEFLNLDETAEVSTSINNNIKDVFIKGIEENLKNEILEMGYVVNFINVEVDYKYENIKKIKMEISKNDKKIASITPVEISLNETKDSDEFMNIKQYINENYKVELENIIINTK